MYEAAEADLVKAVEDEERVVGHKGSREDHLPGDQGELYAPQILGLGVRSFL